MFQFFPMPLSPQGISLFLQFFTPLRSAAVPATLSISPDADPEDDPE